MKTNGFLHGLRMIKGDSKVESFLGSDGGIQK